MSRQQRRRRERQREKGGFALPSIQIGDNKYVRPILGAIGATLVIVIAVLVFQNVDFGGPPPLAPSTAHALGDANAPVTVVEFSDFQ